MWWMISKSDKIRAAWAAGDRIGALRIAARFFDRSAVTMIFKRGMDANNHPAFYRQLGRGPDLIVAEALDTLASKFGLQMRPRSVTEAIDWRPPKTIDWPRSRQQFKR